MNAIVINAVSLFLAAFLLAGFGVFAYAALFWQPTAETPRLGRIIHYAGWAMLLMAGVAVFVVLVAAVVTILLRA